MEKNTKIDKSKNIVIGTGNRVVQKVTEIYHSLGKKQFISLSAGILLLLVAVIIGIEYSRSGQELIYTSVNEIKDELNELSLINNDLKSQIEDKKDEILKAFSDGIQLLKKENYNGAIVKFESIAKDVPLAGIYNNIGYAYAQIGDNDQAEIYFRKATKLKTTSKAAAKNLRQLFYGLKSRYWATCYTQGNPYYSVKVEVNENLVAIVHLSELTIDITQYIKPGINKVRFIATKTAPKGRNDWDRINIMIGPGIKDNYGDIKMSQIQIKYLRLGVEKSDFDETFEFLAE